MGLNGNSACGASNSQAVTGVPDPLGAPERSPWSPFKVIW